MKGLVDFINEDYQIVDKFTAIEDDGSDLFQHKQLLPCYGRDKKSKLQCIVLDIVKTDIGAHAIESRAKKFADVFDTKYSKIPEDYLDNEYLCICAFRYSGKSTIEYGTLNPESPICIEVCI